MMQRRPNNAIIRKDGSQYIGGTQSRSVAERFTHCWRKSACDGAELPQLRRAAGVCEACMKAERTHPSLAATVLANISDLPKRRRVHTTLAEARERGQQNTKRHRRHRWGIPDVDLPRTSGLLTLVTGVTVLRRIGVQSTANTEYRDIPHLEVRCQCGEQYFVRRSSWTHKGDRPQGCKPCMQALRSRARTTTPSDAEGLRVVGVRFIGKRKAKAA